MFHCSPICNNCFLIFPPRFAFSVFPYFPFIFILVLVSLATHIDRWKWNDIVCVVADVHVGLSALCRIYTQTHKLTLLDMPTRSCTTDQSMCNLYKYFACCLPHVCGLFVYLFSEMLFILIS